ncbi:hypothetical protein F5144DRAFT_594256 [Chaetomium tenue]|uniref:Uncharacterized protein n=1 Tax=Chaetomium tenue TaxID=1854479 RepID=A0ACB7P363_9PEZI|nr:hypothetical protein F5144DRAFT_594256 [Chaetomium globosum]
MEQINRRSLERTQYRQLMALWQHLGFHAPGTLDDAALHRLGVYEDQIHPINIYKKVDQEDMSFSSPMGDCSNSVEMYLTGYYMVPTAADTPHLGITMLNPTVAPEGKALESELKAAVACLWAQTRFKQFTNHHTKPILIITFQLETHARITQAHMDPQTNTIILRQSRQLELGGAPGVPPPDALLLIRWLLNSPVGVTGYGDGDGEGNGERSGGQAGGEEASVRGVGVEEG